MLIFVPTLLWARDFYFVPIVALFLFFSYSAYAEVYLSKDEALKVVLECATSVEYLPKLVNDSIKKQLIKNKLWGQGEHKSNNAHFFRCNDNKGIRYALIDSEIGKHLPITYIVGIKPPGEVIRVEMMVFREIRGWEARERRFMAQFEKENSNSNLDIGRGIRNVTGATLSSRAISRGVKRALFLWHNLIEKNQER